MEDRIRDYLQFRMPEAGDIVVTNVEKVIGGSSRETISFEAQWSEQGRQISRSLIIRMDPTASLLESDRELEFRVMQSLESTSIPVPKTYWLELDEKWLGKCFFIMEKVPGNATPFRTGLFAPENATLRSEVAKQWVEILVHIHTVDWKELGLSFLGVPEVGTDCAQREIEKWEEVIDKHKLEPQPILTEALLWLKKNKPETEHITLLHGDFKQDNILFKDEKITAILDWEMTHLGDPMEDLGWACIGWYRQDTPLICGLIERHEFFRSYQELSGIKVDESKILFYEVLGNVKMIAICLTGVRSFSEGKNYDLILGLIGLLLPKLESDLANLLGF